MPTYPITLLILDPGHFHADLIHKQMYPDIDAKVHVYAPEGPELNSYLRRVRSFNARTVQSTRWILEVYTGEDFLEKMLTERKGKLVVIAGNNKLKTTYIQRSVEAGLHVLADKPMAIHSEDFIRLQSTFATAQANGVLLYDIMTERYEITNTLQKELARFPALFGTLLKGGADKPSIEIESVHHFFKYVSGKAIQRPPWYFDVQQQGAGIVDVSTHLIDLIIWTCFPNQAIDLADVEVYAARHWPTLITQSQFHQVTQLADFPTYLLEDVNEKGQLEVLANGEIYFKLKDIHIKVIAKWDYEAPEGGGDTHYAIMRGSKANLVIRQGVEQAYIPALYVEVEAEEHQKEAELILGECLKELESTYPGLSFENSENGWEILIPGRYRIGHEAHFAQVMEKYIGFLKTDKLPDWEVPNMIAKYYITTEGLKIAQSN